MVQRIKDNSDNIAIYIIIIMMAMQVSLFKIFAAFIPLFNASYNTPIICAIYLLMIAAIYGLVVLPRLLDDTKLLISKYKYLIIELVVLLLAIASTDAVTLIKHQLRVTNILTHNLDYIYTFLALPLVILLVEGKWKWDSFVDVILSLSAASMLLRIYVSLYYSWTGVKIACIADESAIEFWFRNDRLRVTAPCFIMLCVPLAMMSFKYTKSVYKKALYVLCIALTAFYSVYVWQARTGLLFMAGSVAVMLLFEQMSKRQFYIRWGIVVAGIAGFVAMGGINYVRLSLSREDTIAQFAGENRGHYNAYALFWERYMKTPIFGEGLQETLAEWFPNGRAIWMCDAGIMYSLLPMGILIAIFFLLMFGKGIYVYIIGRKRNIMAPLALSLTLTLIVCETTMDCFFVPIAYMVPFFIAIIEYSSRQDNS